MWWQDNNQQISFLFLHIRSNDFCLFFSLLLLLWLFINNVIYFYCRSLESMEKLKEYWREKSHCIITLHKVIYYLVYFLLVYFTVPMFYKLSSNCMQSFLLLFLNLVLYFRISHIIKTLYKHYFMHLIFLTPMCISVLIFWINSSTWIILTKIPASFIFKLYNQNTNISNNIKFTEYTLVVIFLIDMREQR